MLPGLGWKVALDERQLLLDDGFRERHEDVWPAEVAVDLRNLVLEDHVVAEGVPGQLAGKSMILMEVVAGVGEDDLRIRVVQSLEDLLHFASEIRQEAIPEPMHLDACCRDPCQ